MLLIVKGMLDFRVSMRMPGIVAVTVVGSLAIAVLFAWLTWHCLLDNIDRGMVKVMWGTFTGNGSFGGQ
ncbi:MAG: hypothetical protein ACRYG2_24450 [Janthinobacterium lividum]